MNLTLKDESESEAGTGTLQVGPGTSTAVFFLPALGLSNATFGGNLVIDTDVAVAVNTLRTQGGFQTSRLEGAGL